jgi:hypothetical protein
MLPNDLDEMRIERRPVCRARDHRREFAPQDW